MDPIGQNRRSARVADLVKSNWKCPRHDRRRRGLVQSFRYRKSRLRFSIARSAAGGTQHKTFAPARGRARAFHDSAARRCKAGAVRAEKGPRPAMASPAPVLVELPPLSCSRIKRGKIRAKFASVTNSHGRRIFCLKAIQINIRGVSCDLPSPHFGLRRQSAATTALFRGTVSSSAWSFRLMPERPRSAGKQSSVALRLPRSPKKLAKSAKGGCSCDHYLKPGNRFTRLRQKS